MSNDKLRFSRLPKTQVCQCFTGTLRSAQELEALLKAILLESRLTEVDSTLTQTTNSIGVLDDVTRGLLVEAMRASGAVTGDEMWRRVQRGCAHIKELSQTILDEQKVEEMTDRDELLLLGRLNYMNNDLILALGVSQMVLDRMKSLSSEVGVVPKA